jgi:PAS domain S-box-containing protein
MRTPSIERRFVTVGIAVVAVIVLGFDLFAFLNTRAKANADADRVFDNQAAVIRAEASFVGAPGLAERLGSIGIKATVIAPDGTRVESNPARPSTPPDVPLTTREVPVGRGLLVLVESPSAARDPRVRHVLALEAAITPLALILAALLLRWIAKIATKPLDEIAARARLTTEGQPGERLHPDRPETRLGQMAIAYDNMLDSLEGAVAEARAARAESDRLERRTSKILETAHEAFLVMDSTGAIIEWNPGAERIFGWTRDEIIGRSWEDSLIPEDLRQRLENGRAANGGHLWPVGTRTTELEAVRKDGRCFPAGVTVWATEHEGVCTFNAFVSDLTERRQAEEAMAQLAAIVESSDQAMLSTDPGGVVLTWNPAAERMYGYSASEAIGRDLAGLIVPPDLLPVFRDALGAVARGEVLNQQVLRRRKDGSLVHVALTIAPLLDAAGAIYGACSVARDMTEERRMASELDSSLEALARAADEARASEVRTRRFLDDAAHQLRSPITSIRACADTLQRDITPAQQARLLEAVCRDSERASRLMAGLLRMARLGQEQARERQWTDVLALCEEEADRGMIESPELDIVARALGRPLGLAWLRPDPVREILSNLVDNARRHARSRIEITAEPVGDGIELRVVDDGPGLPEGQSDAVFERFVSLDHRGGSGLGLAIARELARAHGGDLTYEERAFVLRLPCELEPVADSHVAAAPGRAPR